MVASRVRQPMPALLDPNERNQPQDRRQRRTQERARPASRQPRANFDSLAIGAPLTAALVGVLVAEGNAAFGEPGTGSAAAGAGAARHGHAEAGRTDPGVRLTRHDAAGAGGVQNDPLVSTSGEIFDPVAATDAANNEVSSDGGAPEGLATAAGVAAALAAQGALPGGFNITIGTGTPPDDLGFEGSSSGEGATGSSGRIGATIVGSAGDDVIHGTPFNDRLFGGAGNDTIFGYAGDDLLDGGSGDDQLFGGADNDRLLGGSGNDGLFGGTGDDALFGGTGHDSLFGEEGRDWLDGGTGNDHVDGGPGADRMFGNTGDDVLVTDHRHDTALENGRGSDDGGNDTLQIAAGFGLPDGIDSATFVFSEHLGEGLPPGAAGYRQQVGLEIENLTLQGSANHDVFADSGNNRLTGNAGDNLLYGDSGDDILIGGAGADALDGGSGGDWLDGGSGNDALRGGASEDQLYGGDGDDLLDGGAGGDRLYGGGGNDNFIIGLNDSAVDTVFDNEGNNWLTIQSGAELVQTAVAGDELYVFVNKNPIGVVDDYLGNEGTIAGIDSGAGIQAIGDLMAPGAASGPALGGTSTVSTPVFHADDDLLGAYLTRPNAYGTNGSDHLVGTSASDWLNGGAGDDYLVGGGGRDVLESGAGHDILEGGAGDDRYLFRSGEAGWNIIRDVEGSNLVELDGFAGAHLKGVVVGGHDLVVVANNNPIFTFEDFVGNEQAFAGVQVGDAVVSAEDLLS